MFCLSILIIIEIKCCFLYFLVGIVSKLSMLVVLLFLGVFWGVLICDACEESIA